MYPEQKNRYCKDTGHAAASQLFILFVICPMRYLVHTPFWLKWIYPDSVWNMPSGSRTIYLTFDDGPHPEATSFVLDQLAIYGAQATFFCVGENVVRYPAMFRRILDAGHAVGNHTHHHLNGFKTETEDYLRDVDEAFCHIPSKLFRPPYGRIRSLQRKQLKARGYSMVMWSVLSADFDKAASGEKCLRNVLENAQDGSIILFHDSEKAWEKMSFVLPRVLARFSGEGFLFKKIAL
jgi:peptidoglycan/xylan/chitin deacetylase (PgdA/CDA1 family)